MKHQFKQQGLTLVELMVAVVLGMLVMVGVIQLFIANKESYRTQDGLARVQEAGRFAAYMLSADIAGAGNLGCTGRDYTVLRSVAQDVPDELALDDENKMTTLNGIENVSGTVTVAVSGAKSTVITPVPGTDLINIRGVSTTSGVRYLSGAMGSTSADITLGFGNLAITSQDLLYIGSCTSGNIFRASNSVTASSTGPLQHALSTSDATPVAVNSSAALTDSFGEDAVIGKLRSFWYYIKLSTTRDHDGHAVYSLHRVDEGGVDTSMVDGVEDMQITYGINDNNDDEKLADRYVTAADIDAGDWEKVISVKINLLVNSVSRAARSAVTYDYSPVGDDQTPTDSGDYRLRREFTFVSTLRNHTR